MFVRYFLVNIVPPISVTIELHQRSQKGFIKVYLKSLRLATCITLPVTLHVFYLLSPSKVTVSDYMQF